MAHVVGVPRRDPCQKCQLPVFLAERLLIGKQVYHRTCLKCARCGSQLTPGSFYETEVNNEYCCETCPDEEEQLDTKVGYREKSGSSSSISSPTATTSVGLSIGVGVGGGHALGKTVRNSLSERLAFFEHAGGGGGRSSNFVIAPTTTAAAATTAAGHKVLEKSVSDEEKQQRMASEAAAATQHKTAISYKTNVALSHFLQDTIDGEQQQQKDDDGDNDSNVNDIDATMEEEQQQDLVAEEKLQLPELPKSMPPTIEAKETSPVAPQRFTATAELRLSSDAKDLEQQQKEPEMELEMGKTPQPQQKNMHAVDVVEETAAQQATDKLINAAVVTEEDRETTARLNVVSAQLRDLAANANNSEQNETQDSESSITLTAREELSATPHNDDEIYVNQSEQETEGEESMPRPMATPNQIEQDMPLNAEIEEETSKQQGIEIGIDDKDAVDVDDVQAATPFKIDSDTAMATTITAACQEPATTTTSVNETVTKAEPETAVEAPQPVLNEKEEATSPVPAHAPTTAIASTPNDLPAMNKQADVNYPDSLNPFDSDDDDAADMTAANTISGTTNWSSTPKSEKKDNSSLNPFDSSDDEIELEKSRNSNMASTSTLTPGGSIKVPPPRPPPPRISLTRNQLSATDASVEEDNTNSDGAQFQRRSSLTSSLGKKVPLPTPRTSLSLSQTPTPEPTPRLSNRNVLQHEQVSGSVGSLNASAGGTAAAAAAAATIAMVTTTTTTTTTMTMTMTTPMQRDADMRGSNNSLASSAGGTIRSRKSRRAPAPPPVALKELFPDAEHNVAEPQHSHNNNNNNHIMNSSYSGTGTGTDSAGYNSKATTPGSSAVSSPKSSRKKRPAPAPPKPARLESIGRQMQAQSHTEHIQHDQENNHIIANQMTDSKNSHSYPLQSEFDSSKLSDEEKALLEGKTLSVGTDATLHTDYAYNHHQMAGRRMIPLDDRLLSDNDENDDAAAKEHTYCNGSVTGTSNRQRRRLGGEEPEDEPNVFYRRLLVPSNIETPTHDAANPLLARLSVDYNNSGGDVHNRQLEKLKDNKEAQNRNRQSQVSTPDNSLDAAALANADASPFFNKSTHGKWKRRKGPAPALPIPPRKVLQMLPLQEIRHELEIIEVQQQGLEKQGVILEKMIRDRCEGQTAAADATSSTATSAACDVTENCGADAPDKQLEQPPTQQLPSTTKHEKTNGAAVDNKPNSKEVEDLILQLFELVNEKNELFRRQAELMYLRRQHRLEQEQADIEYEIRVLMGQPERNKTDTDKAREEALIARLVEVVELRNEVIDCLEMDRLREAEEDLSIKTRLELHNAKRESSASNNKLSKSANAKLSKKEKKQQKEVKKLSKSKKLDADKDADETELKLSATASKEKSKKKRKLFF